MSEFDRILSEFGISDAELEAIRRKRSEEAGHSSVGVYREEPVLDTGADSRRKEPVYATGADSRRKEPVYGAARDVGREEPYSGPGVFEGAEERGGFEERRREHTAGRSRGMYRSYDRGTMDIPWAALLFTFLSIMMGCYVVVNFDLVTWKIFVLLYNILSVGLLVTIVIFILLGLLAAIIGRITGYGRYGRRGWW